MRLTRISVTLFEGDTDALSPRQFRIIEVDLKVYNPYTFCWVFNSNVKVSIQNAQMRGSLTPSPIRPLLSCPMQMQIINKTYTCIFI